MSHWLPIHINGIKHSYQKAPLNLLNVTGTNGSSHGGLRCSVKCRHCLTAAPFLIIAQLFRPKCLLR